MTIGIAQPAKIIRDQGKIHLRMIGVSVALLRSETSIIQYLLLCLSIYGPEHPMVNAPLSIAHGGTFGGNICLTSVFGSDMHYQL